MSRVHTRSESEACAVTESTTQEFWGRDVGREHMDAIRRHVALGESVLDVGTGQGAFVGALRAVGYTVKGMDLLRYPEWQVAPGAFVQASAERLPYADRSFDAAIAFEILEHCPRPDAVLREILRCTRRRLILSVPDCNLDNRLRDHNLVPAHWTDRTHCNFFEEGTLRATLEGHGFRILELGRCVKISPSDYFWNTLRIPRPIAKLGRWTCRNLRLVETYWSSMLVVAELPGAAGR